MAKKKKEKEKLNVTCLMKYTWETSGSAKASVVKTALMLYIENPLTQVEYVALPSVAVGGCGTHRDLLQFTAAENVHKLPV